MEDYNKDWHKHIPVYFPVKTISAALHPLQPMISGRCKIISSIIKCYYIKNQWLFKDLFDF